MEELNDIRGVFSQQTDFQIEYWEKQNSITITFGSLRVQFNAKSFCDAYNYAIKNPKNPKK